VSATTTGVTVDEFLTPGACPREAQLIHGEVVVIDPTFEHQRVTGLIFVALVAWTRQAAGRGEAGFGGNWSITADSVVKPDVWWAPTGRTPSGIRSDHPPALAVEVRSPGNWAYDIGPKRTIYETAGVSELWLVDTPANAILVNRRSTSDGPTFDVTLEVPTEETSPPLTSAGRLRARPHRPLRIGGACQHRATPRSTRQARATVTWLAPQAPLAATAGSPHVVGLRPLTVGAYR